MLPLLQIARLYHVFIEQAHQVHDGSGDISIAILPASDSAPGFHANQIRHTLSRVAESMADLIEFTGGHGLSKHHHADLLDKHRGEDSAAKRKQQQGSGDQCVDKVGHGLACRLIATNEGMESFITLPLWNVAGRDRSCNATAIGKHLANLASAIGLRQVIIADIGGKAAVFASRVWRGGIAGQAVKAFNGCLKVFNRDTHWIFLSQVGTIALAVLNKIGPYVTMVKQ